MLSLPVVFDLRARSPVAMLKLPVLLASSAEYPIATFPVPFVSDGISRRPNAVLVCAPLATRSFPPKQPLPSQTLKLASEKSTARLTDAPQLNATTLAITPTSAPTAKRRPTHRPAGPTSSSNVLPPSGFRLI